MGSTVSKVMFAVAAVVACVGLALVFAPAVFTAIGFAALAANTVLTTGLGILGGGLFVGGLFGAAHALLDPNATWSSFAKAFCKGFAIGCVSSAFSLAASAACGPIATYLTPYLGKASPYIVSAVLGGLCGLGTNGVSNLINGRNFFDNWKKALFIGAGIGFVCKGLEIGFDTEHAKTIGGKILKSVLENVDEGMRDIISGINWSMVATAVKNVRLSENVVRSIWNAGEDLIALFSLRRPQQASTERLQLEPQPQAEPQRAPSPTRVHVQDRPQSPPPPYTAGDAAERQEEEKRPLREFDETQHAGTEEEDVFETDDNVDENVPDVINNEQDGVGRNNIDVEELVFDDYDYELEDSEEEFEYEQEAEDLSATVHESLETTIVQPDVAETEDVENDEATDPEPLEALANQQCEAIPTAPAPLEAEDLQTKIEEPPPNASVTTPSSNDEQPHGGGSQILSSHQVITRVPAFESIACPVAQKAKVSNKKHGLIKTVTTAPAEAAKKIRAKVMPKPKYDDNKFVGSLHDLLNLHKRQQTEAASSSAGNSNYMFANVTGGTRLGVAETTGPSTSAGGRVNSTNKSTNTAAQKESAMILDLFKASRKKATMKPSQKAKILANEMKIATVHKLIYADENFEYKLSSREEWPNFSGEMRVIGLMGTPASGKTTMVQSIVFKLGYCFSEAQALLTRVRLGVNAYVLQDHKLIIIECCEGIDPHQNLNTTSKSPYAALLLELFVYSSCSHILFTMQFDTGEVNNVSEYIKQRLLMLLNTDIAHKILCRRAFNLILRVIDKTELLENGAKSLEYIFAEKAKQYDVRFHRQNNKDMEPKWSVSKDDSSGRAEDENLTQMAQPIVNTTQKQLEGNEFVKSEEEKELEPIQIMHEVRANLLRKYELSDNMVQIEEYNSQINQILNSIVSTERSSLTMTSDEFDKNLRTLWDQLSKSECLEKTSAKLRAEEVRQGENNDFGVQNYFKCAENYLTEVSRKDDLKWFIDEYKKYHEEMNRKVGVFKTLPKEEQTPELFVESVIKLANLLLQNAKKIRSTSDLHQKGISLALYGFSLLVRAGNSESIVESMALRMSFFDYNLMEELIRPEIYNNYSDCWFILARLARSGFRIYALQFDFWARAEWLLSQNELPYHLTKVYLNMLSFLEELTDADSSQCVPSDSRDRHAVHYGGIDAQRIAFDFEKEVTDDVFDVLTEVLRDPSIANSEHQKWLKMPEKWFDQSLYAQKEFEDEEAQQKQRKEVMNVLTARNFEILYRLIANEFARKIIEKKTYFVTTKHNVDIDIGKMRLKVWKNVADLAETKKELCISLFKDTNVLEFLVENFIKVEEPSALFPQALNTLCEMIIAEQSFREDKDVQEVIKDLIRVSEITTNNNSNVHELTELLERKRREEMTKRWTYVRLRCLESGLVEKLIPHFCEKHHSLNDAQFLLVALVTFLVACKDEEKQMSEALFIKRRHDLLKCVSALLHDVAVQLSANNENRYESAVRFAIAKYGLYFINRLMDIYQKGEWKEKEEFFNHREPLSSPTASENYRSILSSTADLYGVILSIPQQATSRKAQTNDLYLRLHYFSTLLNLATFSRISVLDVLQSHNIQHVAGIANLMDDIKVVNGEDEFKKLKMDVPYVDGHKLVTVAAHLLNNLLAIRNGSFQVILHNIRAKMTSLQIEIKDLEEDQKKYEEWLRNEEVRRKRERNQQAMNTRPVFVSPSSMPETHASIQRVYAVDDVYCYSPYLDKRWRTGCGQGLPDVEVIRQDLREGRTWGEVDGVLLHLVNSSLSNPTEEDARSINQLMMFCDKLIKETRDDNLPKPRKENKHITRFKHLDSIVLNCGYELKLLDDKEHYVTTCKQVDQRKDYILEMFGTMQSLEGNFDVFLRLDSRFEKVPGPSLEIANVHLPLKFFENVEKEHYHFVTGLTVGELRDRRIRDARVPSQLKYTLVRVTYNGEIHQAVFFPDASVRWVIDQLNSCGHEVRTLSRNGCRKSLREDEILKNIGRFVICLCAA